ncbi:MAG: hypothetical protein OEV49_15140 [candidate division Zixibacteria bacterium]|nr:hypothetical protein [candidate division Zixibacteria bacterium]MDH3936055.1 hypothetical protein [candidate division Zixibacteria bacterium]MDH4034376.1 hypothetical protein [candidate division Zixibacteria bacterium]
MRPVATKTNLRGNCLCAASSALMLYIAHNHPEFWYLSLIAFVPFLWRLLQVGLWDAVCLASTLASLFVLATNAFALLDAFGSVCFELVTYNIAFVAFALGINRAKTKLGFDPLMIALLWFPIEYVLIIYADVGSVFSVPDAGLGAAVSFCTLFGFALGSFVVVLVNALILWLAECIARKASADCRASSRETQTFYVQTNFVTLHCNLYYLLGPRAPPVVITWLERSLGRLAPTVGLQSSHL